MGSEPDLREELERFWEQGRDVPPDPARWRGRARIAGGVLLLLGSTFGLLVALWAPGSATRGGLRFALTILVLVSGLMLGARLARGHLHIAVGSGLIILAVCLLALGGWLNSGPGLFGDPEPLLGDGAFAGLALVALVLAAVGWVVARGRL